MFAYCYNSGIINSRKLTKKRIIIQPVVSIIHINKLNFIYVLVIGEIIEAKEIIIRIENFFFADQFFGSSYGGEDSSPAVRFISDDGFRLVMLISSDKRCIFKKFIT